MAQLLDELLSLSPISVYETFDHLVVVPSYLV